MDILKSLEVTFGKIPSFIDNNAKYLSSCDASNEFTCIPCNKVMKVVNSRYSTTKNFKSHLLSKSHRNETFTWNEVMEALRNTFCGKVPQIVVNNVLVLDINGINYSCVLCNKKIKVTKESSITEGNFSYHLLSGIHIENLEKYRDTMSELIGIFGGLAEAICNNKRFLRLTRSGKNYVCTICNVLLIVDQSDIEETEERFKSHFFSESHLTNVELEKAFSLYPKLKGLSKVPNYLLGSIDYISRNNEDFFCSLCNENIKCNQNDYFKSEQNIKLHILFSGHENNLLDRWDNSSEVFVKLSDIYGTFADIILENRRCLNLEDNSLYCSICEEEILDTYQDIDELEDYLIEHYESDSHQHNLTYEEERHSCLIQDLEDLFGRMPDLILTNLKYIEFKGKNNFECTLCGAILQSKENSDDFEYIEQITQENFEKHLSGSQHIARLENKDNMSDTETELEELFEPIPGFIFSNLDHIQYQEDCGDFHCILCDIPIIVDQGNKKKEITLNNFRNHMFSFQHIKNLKVKAKSKMEATEKLKSIFGGVPNFILSNAEYLYKNGHSFKCKACDAKIIPGNSSESTEQNFYNHFSGSRHKRNLEEIEFSIDTALQYLDSELWRLPEFLLKNIDFLCTWDDDELYCTLCQKILFIDSDDLEATTISLRCHMDSEEHMINLKNL